MSDETNEVWWTISGSALLDALTRANQGEDPDLIYAEMYANSASPDEMEDDL